MAAFKKRNRGSLLNPPQAIVLKNNRLRRTFIHPQKCEWKYKLNFSRKRWHKRLTKFSAAPKIDFSDKHEDFCSASFPREHTFLWITFIKNPGLSTFQKKLSTRFRVFVSFFTVFVYVKICNKFRILRCLFHRDFHRCRTRIKFAVSARFVLILPSMPDKNNTNRGLTASFWLIRRYARGLYVKY